jgi:hypothetical protein
VPRSTPGRDPRGRGRGPLTLSGRRLGGLCVLLLLSLFGGRAATEELLADQWQLLLLDGQEVGNLHVRSYALQDGFVRTEQDQSMAFLRFGRPFSVSQKSTWIERGEAPGTGPAASGSDHGAAGSDHGAAGLQRVDSVILLNGQRQEIEATTEGGVLQVRRREGPRTTERSLEAEGEVLGPFGADRRIATAVTAAWDADGAPNAVRFFLFSPESGSIEQVDLRLLGPGELSDSRGTTYRGMLVEQRSSALPGIVSREVYAGDGSLRYSRTEAGVALEIIGLPDGASPASPPGSGAAGVGESQTPDSGVGTEGEAGRASLFDVAAFVIPVSGLPARPGALSFVREPRLAFNGPGVSVLEEALRSSLADLGGAGPHPVSEPSGYSEPSGASGESSTLVVALESPAPPGPLEPPPAGGSGLNETLRVYLKDGFHLGLNDPRLDSLLGRCPERESLCLEGVVNRYLVHKSFGRGFAGLPEILDSREGDCTEASLLLAGLLRKLGLPARQAYGLLLTEAGLVGHAWTEVYQGGCWYWLDPSFPGGAPYGFKLRLGTLDPAEPVWGQFGTALLTLRSSVRVEMLP